MQVDLSPLFELQATPLRSADFEREAEALPRFLESWAARKQGFATLPHSKAPLLAVRKVLGEMNRDYGTLVVLGIGGSALGISALRDFCKGPNHNLKGKKRVFVLDNLDSVAETESLLDLSDTLFVVISKSGTTVESMAQYFYFRAKVPREQFIFITSAQHGELYEIAKEEQIPWLEIPENIGGRYSVLTPVGLLPAAFLGLDLDALLEGAAAMSEQFFSLDWRENGPFQLAVVQYLLERRYGVTATVMMPYSTALSTFSDWYAQLLAESIGKQGLGLTPISALGATDQHSQIQLYNEGPRDKFLIFMEVTDEKTVQLPKIDRPAFRNLSERSFHELMKIELDATAEALADYDRPAIRIQIKERSEAELGALFQFFECAVAFLGELYSINAFDQPGVELAKKLIHQRLNS